MATLTPLSMSQSKEDLLRHLDMSPETYKLMAQETHLVYLDLTKRPENLKSNAKQKPPFDWSDIVEKAKDEAILKIASSRNDHTSAYWNLAAPTPDCPNWIARWFLYKKFRNTDRRNHNKKQGKERSHSRGEYGKQRAHSSSQSSYYDQMGIERRVTEYGEQPSYYSNTRGQVYDYQYGYATGSSSGLAPAEHATYETYQADTSYQQTSDSEQASSGTYEYFDPVRAAAADMRGNK